MSSCHVEQIFSMDIRKQLAEYQVEYNVLQEELTTTNHHLESLRRTRETNKHLETQLQVRLSTPTFPFAILSY